MLFTAFVCLEFVNIIFIGYLGNEGELLMRSVCDIMVREIDTFMDKSREVEVITSSPDKNRQHLTLALCLALRLQTLIETNSFLISSWTQILRTSKLIQRLISVTSTALKVVI